MYTQSLRGGNSQEKNCKKMAPLSWFLLLLAAAFGSAALSPQLGGLGGGMVFMENNTKDAAREKLNFTIEEMHAAQIEEASHYRMVVMGWGEDEGDLNTDSPYAHEGDKLASILSAIKKKSSSTLTVAYCGQFENVVPFYDAQLKIINDKSMHGFLMKDDEGHLLPGASAGGTGGAIWDFRNASARAYLAEYVAGYFARADGVDGVFFDEGDSFACHYSCEQHKTCKTMPNATEWQAGANEAWRLAAEEMARAGKHAVISSQNSFKKFTPYLMKTPHGCPLTEDDAFRTMNASALARAGWMRFYEYFAHPANSAADLPLYCANQVRNAAHEAQVLKVPFVASGSDYPIPGGGSKKSSLEFQLAMFLVARGGPSGPPSYFEYNHESRSRWPRWGDAETSWAEVEALYTREYGDALADVTESPANVFTRDFEKLTVQVDCNHLTSNYTWK